MVEQNHKSVRDYLNDLAVKKVVEETDKDTEIMRIFDATVRGRNFAKPAKTQALIDYIEFNNIIISGEREMLDLFLEHHPEFNQFL